jgi:diacylglycerol kinase family enzyme
VAGFLVVNPRAGDGDPALVQALRDAAERRGVRIHVLAPGEEVESLARDVDADALGVAGGDGSLAPVASVAIERGLPFVCVPFGTRNHFARDLGLAVGPAVSALAAFEGTERRVDVGRVNTRAFLNNVSLGLYAGLVHRRAHHRLRRESLATVRALARSVRDRHPLPLVVDGRPLAARVVLVANNAYEHDLFSLGARPRLDEGRLHLYAARGVLPGRWEERAGVRFRIDSSNRPLHTAIDGEHAELAPPLEFTIEPGALRVLVPPGV